MLGEKAVHDICEWARKTGLKTPTFLLAPQVIDEGVNQLRRHLGGRLSYATKSNAHPLVLCRLGGQVDFFNVTNVAHVDLLLSLGIEADRLACLNPVMSEAGMEAILARGVRRFAIDDFRGLHQLLARRKAVSVAIRVLPPALRASEFSVVKFGASVEDATKLAVTALAEGVDVEALTFFLGGGVASPDPFRDALEAVAQVYAAVAREGVAIRAINIGGGFPGFCSVVFNEQPAFFEKVREAFQKRFPVGVELWSEPGRFLCQPAVALLSRVITSRSVGGRRFVYLDASAYGGLSDCFIHKGEPLIFQVEDSRGATTCEVVGPVMDSHDVIRRSALLPDLVDGQLVLIPNVGAYTWSMSTTCEGIDPPQVVELPPELQEGLRDARYAKSSDESADPCAS